ncbi:23127_t:CDS:2, partial [Racocetra persica]
MNGILNYKIQYRSSPKYKNAISPTSRFKNKGVVQSPVTNPDITEIDASSEENNDNDVSEPSTSRSRSSNIVKIDNSKADNNVSGLSTPIQYATRSLQSSRFSTQLSATSSTTTEVD